MKDINKILYFRSRITHDISELNLDIKMLLNLKSAIDIDIYVDCKWFFKKYKK